METDLDVDLPLLDLPDFNARQLGVLESETISGKVTLPLSSVDIKARVVERVASVTVRQSFRNSYGEHLEAIYIFPLAAGCAVLSVDMRVGDRVVKGVVRERQEARRQYQEALSEGKRAAMMEQERDDVFTIAIGNIPPGEEIAVEITYSECLPFFEDGRTELRLPLVVSPRYVAGAPLEREPVGHGTSLDTDLVPDASRITPPRLAPGLDPQTALTLSVEIACQDESEVLDLSCSQHATRMSLKSGEVKVTLSQTAERLNRDFVLRWCASGEKLKSTLLCFKADDAQLYGMLSVVPPRRQGYLGSPRDVLFVLDRSGSMGGVKMTSAARACAVLLNTLGSRDRFGILAFDDVVEWMPTAGIRMADGHYLQADATGVEHAMKYLRGIDARGGTELVQAIAGASGAASGRRERRGRASIIVVITDGEVGNESGVLKIVQQQLGDSRFFAVGVDTAVNAGLLKRLATIGGGTAAFVEPGVQLEEALASIAREIGHPLVTDLRVDDLDLEVDRDSVAPARIPDAFAGRASWVFLKLSGKGCVKLVGKLADGKRFEEKVRARQVNMPAIAQLWARSRIVDLEDAYRIEPARRALLKQAIVDLAVKHSILTRFTAFVAVDESELVNRTGDVRTVVQPVEMPDQWEQQQDFAASQRWGALSADLELLDYGAAGGGMAQRAGSRLPKLQMRQGMIRGLNAPPGQPGAAPSPPPGSCEQLPDEADGYALQPDVGWSKLGDQTGSGSSLWGGLGATSDDGADPVSAAQPSPLSARSEPIMPKEAQVPPEAQPVSAPRSLEDEKALAPRDMLLEIAVRLLLWGAPWQWLLASRLKACGISDEDVLRLSAERVKSGKTSPRAGAGNFSSLLEAGARMLGIRPAGDSVTAFSRDLPAIRVPLARFLERFVGAAVLLDEGKRPCAELLSESQSGMCKAMASSSLAAQLPFLQRFLRSTAVELIDCSGAEELDLQSLRNIWDDRRGELQLVCSELGEVLDPALKQCASGGRPFWEDSV